MEEGTRQHALEVEEKKAEKASKEEEENEAEIQVS
eukprot:CAMPEP_0198236648 /NCGR_PEP_ID=MMETSP1446-20131203/2530_1 /TAXON_ID=1461542 ORGANISM="Unidentified sp, Strain CCMP2111" /NCGR_SAMPLE_ID=MMETSP1446 /ASSEMBLY_ACC=CAM_ASM_001112 /LENGTH=34 /DNA_ID= /DNA_START= /DNA_END= /DNA_ORIENTATION=